MLETPGVRCSADHKQGELVGAAHVGADHGCYLFILLSTVAVDIFKLHCLVASCRILRFRLHNRYCLEYRLADCYAATEFSSFQTLLKVIPCRDFKFSSQPPDALKFVMSNSSANSSALAVNIGPNIWMFLSPLQSICLYVMKGVRSCVFSLWVELLISVNNDFFFLQPGGKRVELNAYVLSNG